MRCVIINLPRATDRLSEISREFHRLDLAYEVWPAIDGQKLTDSDRLFVDSKARNALGLYPVPDGSLANTLTQRAVWRNLIASNLEMMAIFEDDARPDHNLPFVLDALTKRSGGGGGGGGVIRHYNVESRTSSKEIFPSYFLISINGPYARTGSVCKSRFLRLCYYSNCGCTSSPV